MAAAKPFLRQFGSKYRVAPRLISMLPAGKTTWVEIFAGTAALTLAKDPRTHKYEHLNDFNGEIVNLFEVLRVPAARARLCELIELTPWAEQEFRNCRAARAAADEVERARRYLVRSWQGMGGVQQQVTGWIGVDGSRTQLTKIWQELPLRISVAAARLKDCAIHKKDALKIVERFGGDRDTILFVDPPYPESAINSQNAYAVNMTDNEHEALARALISVESAVMLTMVPGTIYSEILSDWKVVELSVTGMRGFKKTELVLMNYPASQTEMFAA